METPTPPTNIPPQITENNKEEKMWAMLCHLGTFIGFVVPLGNIIAPLVIWLIKKDSFPLVEDQGKEALNFQISMFIYFLISALLCLILIGFVALVALAIADIVLTIIAAIKANEGNRYRYPLCIRFIK